MRNINKYFIVCILMLGSYSAYAQKDTTLNQSLTVERDFSPIVREAIKIDQQPKVEEIKVKKSSTRYADWFAPTATSSEIGRMPIGQVIVEDDPCKLGYLELSAGNYINADLKAGLTHKGFSLDIDGFFTKGDLELPYPSYSSEDFVPFDWNSRLMNGNVKVGYDYTFINSSRMRVYASASGRNYNMLNAFYKPTTELSYTHDFQDDIFALEGVKEKQKVGRLSAGVSYEISDASFDFGFTHSGSKLADISENSLDLRGQYGWYNENGWQMVAALNLGVQFAEENYFVVSPEIEFSRFFPESLSRFYVNYVGGITRRDLYDVMCIQPLLLNADYSTEKKLFDFTLGYENNDNGSFKWGMYAGVALTLDRLDAFIASDINSNFYRSSNDSADKNGKLYSYAVLTRSDEFEFKAGAYMDYQYNKFFGVNAGAKINANTNFGNPLANIDFHVLSNPITNLYLKLGIDAGLKREMDFKQISTYSYSDMVENINTFEDSLDLGNIIDFNLRVDYNIKKNFNVFFCGKNLLNKEYQLWAGVPAQKINVHLGFNCRF